MLQGQLIERTVHYYGTLTEDEFRDALQLAGSLTWQHEKHKSWATHYMFSADVEEPEHDLPLVLDDAECEKLLAHLDRCLSMEQLEVEERRRVSE